MRKIIIIFLILTSSLLVVKSQINYDCDIFKISIESLSKSFSHDTVIYILNHINKFNQKELMSSISKDLKYFYNDSISMTTYKDIHASDDSIVNCEFNNANVKLADRYPYELFFNENYSGKIPTLIIFSNILYFEKEYAYIRFFILLKNAGNITLWFILKKNDEDKWGVIKNGAYI